MKIFIFQVMVVAVIAASASADSVAFAAPPHADWFSDGAVEWSADILCPDPASAQGATLAFAWDGDLDGRPDQSWDTTWLVPQDCLGGELHATRTFFPSGPALLLAALEVPGESPQTKTVLAGASGSILSVRNFCARPQNGEPEWVEIENATPVPVHLDQVQLQGHPIGSGILDPGGILAVGPDSAGMARWIPGLPARALSPWPPLRNSGDTIRLAFAGGVTLDSAIYSASLREPREACADQANAAGVGFGFSLEAAPTPWRPADGPLDITVQAPPLAAFELAAFDLEGTPLCKVADHTVGPAHFSWSVATCPALAHQSGAVLLQLQPDQAPPLRQLIPLQRR